MSKLLTDLKTKLDPMGLTFSLAFLKTDWNIIIKTVRDDLLISFHVAPNVDDLFNKTHDHIKSVLEDKEGRYQLYRKRELALDARARALGLIFKFHREDYLQTYPDGRGFISIYKPAVGLRSVYSNEVFTTMEGNLPATYLHANAYLHGLENKAQIEKMQTALACFKYDGELPISVFNSTIGLDLNVRVISFNSLTDAVKYKYLDSDLVYVVRLEDLMHSEIKKDIRIKETLTDVEYFTLYHPFLHHLLSPITDPIKFHVTIPGSEVQHIPHDTGSTVI